MKFIHFGCWNNIDCKQKTNYRDIVIDCIDKFETDYEFIVISGDNWYNNEDDHAKYYYVNVLQSGLVKLYNLDKPVHIILGNHDEDTDNDVNALKSNCMLHTEEHTIMHIDDIKDLRANMTLNTQDKKLLALLHPSLEYLYATYNGNIQKHSKLILYKAHHGAEHWYDKLNKILFIFLNTNIFYSEDEEKIYPYLQSIVDIVHEHESIYIKNIIIVGHVPITSKIAKSKNNFQNNISNNKHIIDAVIRTFKSITPMPLYLCADTHNFQILSIEGIIQVVAGTGGADPEKPLNKGNINLLEYTVASHKVSGYYHNAYGYSIIDIEDDDIKVIYKHIIESDNGLIINKEYEYKIGYNGQIQLNTIRENSMDTQIINNIISISKNNAVDICTNLNENNLIKSEDKQTYCFQKRKTSKLTHTI